MSTRADFYIGRGPRSAQYVGSISHDAWPDTMQPYFAGVTTGAQFREALEKVFSEYGAIRPEFGWPWPWKDSATTDTVICLHDNQVWAKHYSGYWAPLARFNRPSRVKTRFPDMTRGASDSAEGRLRRRIAINGGFQVRTDQDVLSALLVRVAYSLTRFWAHAHTAADGQVLALEPSDDSCWALRDALEALVADPDGIRQLVAARQKVDPSDAWELLEWALGARWVTWMPESVLVPYSYELPMYFAQPTPTRIPREQLPDGDIAFKKVDLQLYAQGIAHLEKVWTIGRFVYGNALAAEMNRLSDKRITENELLTVPCLADGGTAENRQLAREHAGRTFWAD